MSGGETARVRYCSSYCLLYLHPYPRCWDIRLQGVARLAPCRKTIIGFMGLVDAGLVGIPVLTTPLVVVGWIAVTGDFTWMGRWIAPMG